MIMMGNRKPLVAAILGHDKREESDAGEGMDALQACAEELIQAVHEKDAASVVSAIRAMFEELDAEPHVEGEHLNEE